MSDLDEVASVRTDGDSWEITDSVGATALWVAACRAAETAQPHPLIRDELARLGRRVPEDLADQTSSTTLLTGWR